MGMAASQARLLSITSRLADNELRAQIANNAKMRLASDSSRISADYVNALNNATMMITNYNEVGDQQFNKLTFNKLTQYSPFNTQYGLANTYGQLLVNENEAKIFEAAGGSLNKFLAAHGLEFTTSYFSSEAFNGATTITFDDEKGLNLGSFTLDELKAMYFGGNTDIEGVNVSHNGYMENEDLFDSFLNQTSYFAGKYQQAQQDENIMNMIDEEIYAFKDSSSYLSQREQAVQELRRIYADSSDFEQAKITEGNGANKLAQVLTLIRDMSVDTDGETISTDKKVKGATNDYYSSIVDYYFKKVTDDNGVEQTVLREIEDFGFNRKVINNGTAEGKVLVEEGREINGEWVPYTQNVQTVASLTQNENFLNYDDIEDTWSAWDGATAICNYLWHDEPCPSSWADDVFGTIDSHNTYAIQVVGDDKIGSLETSLSGRYAGLPRGYVYLSKDSHGNLKFMYAQNNSDDGLGSYVDGFSNYNSMVGKIAGENKHYGVYELDILGQDNGLTVEYDDTLTYLLEAGSGYEDRSKFYANVLSNGKIYSTISTTSLANITDEILMQALAAGGGATSGDTSILENRSTVKNYFDALDLYDKAKNIEVREAQVDANGRVISEAVTQEQKEQTVKDALDLLVDKTSELLNALVALGNIDETSDVEVSEHYDSTTGKRYTYITRSQLEGLVGCSADNYKLANSSDVSTGNALIVSYFMTKRAMEKELTELQEMISDGCPPMLYYSKSMKVASYQEQLLAMQDALIEYLDSIGLKPVTASEEMNNAFIFTSNNCALFGTGTGANDWVEYHNFAWTEVKDYTDQYGDNAKKYFIVDPDGYCITQDTNGDFTKNTSRTNNLDAYSYDGSKLKKHTFFSVEQAYFYIIQDLVQDAFGQYEVEEVRDANGNVTETAIKDQRGNFRYSVNLMDYIDDPSFKVDSSVDGAAASNAKLDALRDQKEKIANHFGIDLADVESTDFTYVGAYIRQLLENIKAGENAPEGSEARKAAEAAKAIYDNYILNCLFDVYGEPNVTWIDRNNPEGNAEAKVNWYTNLFERMSRGYKVLEDGLANSNEWIEYALESGLCTIEQVDTNNHWNATIHSNVATITEVTDDVAVARAEAEYKKAMNEIESKDKRLDIELKNIDTEHNSLQTEYESISKVISKNIDRTFKMYS